MSGRAWRITGAALALLGALVAVGPPGASHHWAGAAGFVLLAWQLSPLPWRRR